MIGYFSFSVNSAMDPDVFNTVVGYCKYLTRTMMSQDSVILVVYTSLASC